MTQSNRLAEVGADQEASKSRCLIAAKRVGPRIGLKAADLLLLDTLAAFSQPQDWTAGARPIVWPSNAFLMEQTGFSLSTLKRHARRLAEVGVIAFQDSPNGKRWGHRDASGRIVEAYGFDLSPLAAQVDAFEAQAAEWAEERAACQRMRRQITITRRNLRAQLDAGQGSAFKDAFEAILARLPGQRATLDRLCSALKELTELLVLVTSSNANESPKLTPTGCKNDPHIQPTNQHQSVEYKGDEGGIETDIAPDGRTTRPEEARSQIGLDQILQACPEFSSWQEHTGQTLRTWRDVDRLADALHPMIGVSQRVWSETRETLGQGRAAVAFALVFDKTSKGEIHTPSGYLRGLARKAERGELHLERSVQGRLHQQLASAV